MEDFKRTLARFKTEKGQAYTHTSIGNPRISIHVPDAENATFMNAYKSAMLKGVALHMTEKPKDPSPMRVDLDFRFVLPDPKPNPLPRYYLEGDIERILLHYVRSMAPFINMAEAAADPRLWHAYVMEKSSPTEERGKIKDGLHIVWPNLIVSHDMQHYIRNKVLDSAVTMFAGLPVCNSHNDVIDKAIIDRNNWQMYGSAKPDCLKYEVTRIYNYKTDTDELETVPVPTVATSILDFVDILAMRNKAAATPLVPEKAEEIQAYAKCVLPSVQDRNKSKLHHQIFGNIVNLTRNLVSNEECELARELIECLNTTRADNYEDWIKLGWTLRNIDYRLLDAWIDFSRESTKYIEGECQKMWDRMRITTLSMGTLRWWARTDNPLKYEEIVNKNVVALIDKCANNDGAHYDVACVVHAMFKDRFQFTAADTWFMYRDECHRWVRTKEGLQLRKEMSTNVCSQFLKRVLHWNNQAVIQEEFQDAYMKKSKVLQNIALKLRDSGYKDRVMKECKCLFSNEKFEELLDAHPHLIGFENGVYDLNLHQFRDGLPDDYVSYSTGRHYRKYDPTWPEIAEINAFMEQIMPNKDVRKYMWDVMASILDGSIRHEKFYVFTGIGCHEYDTPILMWNGRTQKVQDIRVGDRVMGDDGTPRTVGELFRGRDAMVRVTPRREHEEAFTVNVHHILSLKYSRVSPVVACITAAMWRVDWYESLNAYAPPTPVSQIFTSEAQAQAHLAMLLEMPHILQDGQTIDMSAETLLEWQKAGGDTWWKNGRLSLYRPGTLLFEDSPNAASPAPESAYDDGMLLATAQSALPLSILTSSLAHRREFLRGLLDWAATRDTRRYCVESSNQTFIRDVTFLARGLGHAVTVAGANRIYVSFVPSEDSASFDLELQPVDAYYGFELDGNHRYVMGQMWVTHNSNGKSKILELIQKSVGDYYCILPIALLTQKRTSSNAAQSELERTKGRRFAVMQEPSEGERINIGLMKELSGGDRIMCRALFKEPIEFKPQFKMIMTCNELPEVPGDDNGTWRRIRVVQFKSKFCENPDPRKKNEFAMDTELANKFNAWADIYMSMLIHHHETTDLKAIAEPMDVRIATESYKQNNDMIGQYIEERIVMDPKCTERAQINAIFADFKMWAFQAIPRGKKLPDRNQIRAYIEKMTEVPYPQAGWKGMRISPQRNDDSDSDSDNDDEADAEAEADTDSEDEDADV